MEENKEGKAGFENGYVPRPTWQVWAARIGVVVCVILVIAQVIAIYRGGL